jgi:hypothetical protein
MGTIKKGIMGGFSGKVGAVVGGTWNGITYMRSLPSTMKNPRTKKQLSQRSKFALTVQFLKPIHPYLRVGFKNFAGGQTAFNAAMSYHMINAISGEYPDYALDFARALVSCGSLVTAENVEASLVDGRVSFTWNDNSGIANALANDRAMPLVFNSTRNEAIYNRAGDVRAVGSTLLNLPAHWIGDEIQLYLGFVSDDGMSIANSVYLGKKTVD